MKRHRITIFPSLLAVEKRNTLRHWKEVEPFVEGVHIDPMDGIFVKNTTRFSPAFVCRLKTTKVKDVHLMVVDPLVVLPAYVRAGANEVDIHIETLSNPGSTLRQLRKQFPKLTIFLALNPETPAKKIYPYLTHIDGVLCMTVRPGKGGQPFLSSVLRKIQALHRRAPTLPIKVDGGINDITAKKVITAGATILVSGAYIFQHKNPKIAIRTLQ
ncbi:ribulose-phosphate 3-epimerase [Candidatus Uhrbacteria bacterium]|nr:ribulose-phosphate 3-epimerase [Candidatus Uhrbacteria bacterium]